MKHKDTDMRNCTDCEYADFKTLAIGRCKIDGVINIRWYCCAPAIEIKNFVKLKGDKHDGDL